MADDLARWFVSVKVDREERPDVDAVYMAAVLAMSGSGGWPMSVFCTPDGRPFFGGTYFPPTERPGMPSFRRVLAALADAWSTRRARGRGAGRRPGCRRSAGELDLADRLAAARPPARRPGGPSPRACSSAPWPSWPSGSTPSGAASGRPPNSPARRLSSCACATTVGRRPAALWPWPPPPSTPWPPAASTTTWPAGFARYSTDRRWLVPHFEKMLTDQALLARGYLHAWQVTGRRRLPAGGHRDPRLRAARTWRAPGGGLCSSEDADADGVEGGHATFTPAQVREALRGRAPRARRPVPLDWYGITEAGNWEGTTVLLPPARCAPGPAARASRRPAASCSRPADGRPRPALDDKVAHRVERHGRRGPGRGGRGDRATGLGRRAPRRSPSSSSPRCRSADGRWRRTVGRAPARLRRRLRVAGRVLHPAGRADRAGPSWTARARRGGRHPARAVLGPGRRRAASPPARDGEGLVVRSKELLDGATPSANSVAASALLRLGALTGDDRYRRRRRADRRSGRPAPRRAPDGGGRPRRRGLVLDARHRGGGGRRPPRPAGRGPPRAGCPTAVVAWGERHRLTPVGGQGPEERLRLPAVRMPGAGRRPRYPGRPARRRVVGRHRDGRVERGPDQARPARRRATEKARSPRSLLRDLPRDERVPVEGGARLRLLVLACTADDTTAVDLSSGALVRLRVPWPEEHAPDLAPFDVVEAMLGRRPRARRPGPARGGHRRRPPPPGGDLARPPGPPHARSGWRPRPTGRCSASPGRPPPTGSSAAPAPRPPWSTRPGGPSSSAGRPTARPGSASAGSATTSGCRWRTAHAASRPRRGTPGAAGRQGPGDRARLHPPVPAGHAQPAPRRATATRCARRCCPRRLSRPGPDSAAELAPGQVLGHGPAEGHQPVAGVGVRPG